MENMRRTLVFCLSCLWAVHLTWADSTIKYDFEDTDQLKHFTAMDSNVNVDQTFSKSKKHSMLWTMQANSAPTLELKLVTAKETRHFALKFWMYRETRPSKDIVMTLTFKDENTGDATPPVRVHLDFKGWRAVWITFRFFEGYPFKLPVKQVTHVKFAFASSLSTDEKVYFDLVRVFSNVFWHRETRDKIVRKESPLVRDEYDEKSFWQKALKWAEFPVPAPDNEDTVYVEEKIADIKEIENRLDDWFADRAKGLHDDGVEAKKRTDFENFRNKRWFGMQRSMFFATRAFEDNLTFENNLDGSKAKIKGPPLFGLRSEYGHYSKPGEYMKFGFVFQRMLFPLAIEYALKNRSKEVNDTARAECVDLATPGKKRNAAVSKIAGTHATMNEFLESKLPSAESIDCTDPNSLSAIKESIGKLNDERWRRIEMLLEYLEDQGWSDGSGLGSMDQEMNQSGTSFMLALFLIRKKLKLNPLRHSRWLKTAKWYHNFHDIYRSPEEYTYDGENADTCRNILRNKLHIIVMQRDTSEEEKQSKIRDMRYYRMWVEHSLKINHALGGLVKPDYTGFHHMTVYAPAYVPDALHNIAMVSYQLEGTHFSLKDEAKHTLRKALGFMRILAVKYSTPNALGGRFSGYIKETLIKHMPAFAYISYIPSYKGSSPKFHDPGMFLRLCDLYYEAVGSYLGNGYIASANSYYRSMGSFDIMREIKEQASEAAEDSPSGHWSSNFACMNVHRRKDWSVTVKGFGRYVWDYESSGRENKYGLFQSHGALQISNSEATLATCDVSSGWDWTHVPGTTTINLDLDEFQGSARTYNHAPLAGGVSLRGSSSVTAQNGVFGMELRNPPYRTPPAGMTDLDFVFKKSYFFMDHLIICLGSDIKLQSTSESPINHHAQTTLFQDKQVDMIANQKISVGSSDYDVGGTDVNLDPLIAQGQFLDLKDSHGNTYRVSDVGNSKELRVSVRNQTSKDTSGKDTTGRYATAYLNHEGSNYLYAVLVKGGDTSLLDKYEVKQRDDVAHVVQFTDLPTVGTVTTDYIVFKGNSYLQGGPLVNASAPCAIMTEETGGTASRTLFVALSNPSFKLVDDPNKMTNQMCSKPGGKKMNPPESLNDIGPYLMFCTKSDRSTVTVELDQPVTSPEAIDVWFDNVKVGDPEKSDYVTVDNTGTKITFKSLTNGFSVEAKFNF